MGNAFTETDFPIKEVSAESAREKNIRHTVLKDAMIQGAKNQKLGILADDRFQVDGIK